MKIIDARGIPCPKPVIMSKKFIEDEKEKEFTVLVDNLIATENLSKLAEQMGYITKVKENSKTDFEVLFTQNGEKKESKKVSESSDAYIVVISSDMMGVGDEDFSKKLLGGFIYALTEQNHLPEKIIFYNKGVYIPATWEDSIKDLKFLKERGVEIFSCGLCAGQYGLKEKIQVGTITNMYEIARLMATYRVVKP